MEKKGGKRLAPAAGKSKPEPKAPEVKVPEAVLETAPAANAAPQQTAPAENTAPAAPAAAEAAAQPMSRGRRLWKDYGYMVITLAVVFVLFRIVFQLAYVPSGSMETTLPTKSLLLGWRLPFVVSDPTPERGDIVTFYSDELGKLLVKRVIGLPGDHITFRDGYTYVNGEKLAEGYVIEQGVTDSSPTEFNVPEGHIFLMGDNRPGSYDCRAFSQPYIPLEKVESRVLLAISIGSSQSWQGVHWVA